MLKNRHISVLKDWFEDLDSFQIERHPALLSLLGSMDILYGRTSEGISKLNRAEREFTNEGDDEELALLLVRRSTGLVFLGKYHDALNDVEKALALVRGDESKREIYAEVLHLKGFGYHRIGDLGGAIKYLNESLEIFKS